MIAVLGPEGTFSHELALSLFGDEVVLHPTIHRIFDEVEKGIYDGLVPIENSEAGGVGPTLDCLQNHHVFITAEAYMEVHHHCAAFEGLERLTTIYAHPQTHEQCSEFLEKLGIEVVHTSSNAASARAMKEREHAGAESRLSGLEGEFAKMGDPGKAKELADKAMEMMDSIGFVGEMQRELRDAAEEVGIIEKQQKEYDEMYEVAVRERDEAVGAVKVCPLTLGPVSEECTRVAKEV